MAKVEPYQTGTYKFYCDCGYDDFRVGCSRIVNTSEPNFRCERPIVDATDKPCMLRWKLAPLVAEYEDWKAKEAAAAFLASVDRKKKEAMETLGLTEAQVNGAKAQTVTFSATNDPKDYSAADDAGSIQIKGD